MLDHEIKMPFESLKLNSKQLEVKKGTTLQMAGKKNIKFYYVIKGLLRCYIIDEKGKEHTFMFGPEKWVVGDSVAFSNEVASQLFIDTLEDSELMEYDPFTISENETLEPHEYMNEIRRLLKRIGVLQDRILLLLGASALTRYQHFVTTYPQIVERVPQKMIATYLGITPEALSKVRSEWLKSG